MDDSNDILAPDEDVKLTDGRVVTVREMPWPKAKRLLKRVAPTFNQIFQVNFSSGAVNFDLGILVETLSTDLAEEMIVASTDLTPEGVAGLKPTDVMRLLGPAIRLNVTEALIEAGKALAAHLRPFLPQRSPTPSTSSSELAATTATT